MKKLERMRLNFPDVQDAERLDRWLFEWNLLKESESAEVEEDAPVVYASLHEMAEIREDDDVRQIKELVSEADSDAEAGQIRLMTPRDDGEPVYIAVAVVEPDGMVVCVPFGVLSEPSDIDEILSGRETAVVRVWCLWNRRRLSAEVVTNSWVADRLDEKEMKRLVRAVAACDAGEPLPPDLRQESGPPLIHPLDPRREYRRWERQRIDKAFDCGAESVKNIISYDICAEPQQFLKAAEPDDDYEA
jgi:hypothetical protein